MWGKIWPKTGGSSIALNLFLRMGFNLCQRMLVERKIISINRTQESFGGKTNFKTL
ncbi:MAG: hypothetical protein JGK17_02715 [Microcoleus sp. PH2017_10_PVI_O_A]|uniref:hypothetical protein n=1 Tax=unclassified Microcoleus TaxID=2642155 RepID=UPI001D8B7253|nr:MULTISPECIES: hypothetical protein [unclassified Microcoleus]MCC3526954.1 hypothetical protein [Microcoleus sp. PH2017_21_RUC_O_A]MCC3404498.1 hypothetical protein [Microcoleus sp. PH2017_10_PVI_O_A]MCC3458566.1 hypothetical protein [Microcoleus sp. PH2017_11_PCY_U_A]MCC3476816.1 hypothetical protein [Microcoleus sp. PH2017_12_PCY_D_A]MCC3540397.1 hypothetical protein [Microcoleus sp. PH2017_22_RUC_O_B]